MKYFCLLIFGVLFLFGGPSTYAQVLFEGYSKITMGGSFIGFVIQRYEFDNAKKIFISTSLLKYNEIGGSITETLRATANEALEPIDYIYNMVSPTGSKVIEAKNSSGRLKITTTEQQVKADPDDLFGGKDGTKVPPKGKNKAKVNPPKVQTAEVALPKDAFFSSFLAYVILRNPKGLKAAAEYRYQAIAEEDGGLYKGKAVVQSEETYKGLHVFKILNDFKGDQFISYTTEKGEMIATTAPQKALALELVSEPGEATQGLAISAENLKSLFGNIPDGRVNALVAVIESKAVTNKVIADQIKTAPAATPPPEAVKKLELQEPPKIPDAGKQGTRKGSGIQTKSK